MEPFVLFAIAGAVAPIDSATANATALFLFDTFLYSLVSLGLVLNFN